jgi:hypothetical protein
MGRAPDALLQEFYELLFDSWSFHEGQNKGSCGQCLRFSLHRIAKRLGLWQTVGMTNQQTNQQQCPQHREDYKLQKLIQRIETKLALQAKAVRAQATPSKN